jgi:hypothetical protein
MPALITPSVCREQAAECAELAREERSLELRTALLSLARTWTILAGKLEQLAIIKKSAEF